MLKWIESTGRTEDAAIEAALAQLGMDRDEVSVELLERAKTGFLGVGSRPAKVKVTYEAPDEPTPAPKPQPAPPPSPPPPRHGPSRSGSIRPSSRLSPPRLFPAPPLSRKRLPLRPRRKMIRPGKLPSSSPDCWPTWMPPPSRW